VPGAEVAVRSEWSADEGRSLHDRLLEAWDERGETLERYLEASTADDASGP
jgi:hypothetical protein